MTGPYLPLAGVRVLDLGRLVPAAETTFLLAAMGADVVKVEVPDGGDPIRVLQADDGAPFHQALDRGKRSVALDLRRGNDLEVALALARVADVIVDNSVGHRWAALGFDLAALRVERPSLVVCSITGFGLTGPYAPMGAHGFTMDATGAVLGITWHDGEPVLAPSPCSWANELGSTTAALAITAALLAARATGEGTWIDVACSEAAAAVHRATLQRLITADGEPAGPPTRRSAGAMFAPYRCADGGVVMLATLEQKFWDAFCDGIGRPELKVRYAGRTMAFGAEPDDDLVAELRAVFLSATSVEWQERCTAWGIPGSQVLAAADLLDHPHVAARGLVQGQGDDRYVASAIRWHATNERAGAGLAPAPGLDADRAAVLQDWLGPAPT